MNLIQQLEAKIRARFPTAWVHLEPAATSSGAWFLNIELDGWPVAVEWRPTQGFGITAGHEPSYGDGADEFYPNQAADAATRRMVGLMLAQIQTRPTDAEALKLRSTPAPDAPLRTAYSARPRSGKSGRSPKRFRVVARFGENVFVRFRVGDQTKTAVVHRKSRAASVGG